MLTVWLQQKIQATDIDKVISAKLPDPHTDPLLFDIVKRHMIHRPCGNLNNKSTCMSDGKCTRKYSRDLIKETQTGEDGYPLYRRRRPGDGGFTTYINMHNRETEGDNRWTVPYNPVLSKMFQAHISVEWCHSVKSIKYICNYINKGSDQAVFQLQNTAPLLDEVQSFLLGRYISSNKAVWRILGFPIHERYPTVVHLSAHLENGQRIYFTPSNLQQQLQATPHTTLTAFFHLCRQDAFAKTLLYCDVPRYYTWNASRKQFQRQYGRRASRCLGDVGARPCLHSTPL